MIDEIKRIIKIVDLATELGLQPTKQGFIYSIYKDESNPSLKLYPETNSYYCFSTAQGGDVIKFYADLKGISIKEAVKELAVRAGLENKKTQNSKSTTVDRFKIQKKIELKKIEKKKLRRGL